ncbi:DUF6220 domain-containing protein [Actinomycetospora sp. NBRC 106378]|uniref:DUF6220 domain-containing protein n=1 Tax=Actinomycetospora sp. NBRC 106378 TaxID=3032208 RepID=UPI0024A5B1AF|nr:DUF6220 domain-containing protein [Actinomycetospora sp. NBRC 106378]GLZ51863.1 hypothetical protein Acsp07_14800 [Actinomycetospora sp. NBRC 106378]
MRAVYRVLACLLALEVVVQAASIAWALFGLSTWVENGGVLDKAGMESESVVFDGVAGFAVHGMNGTVIVPALALLFLVSSFFARFPGAVTWAGAAFGLVVVQVALGILAHSVPALGMLHGAVALGLLVVALVAARRSSTAVAVREPATAGAHHAPVV